MAELIIMPKLGFNMSTGKLVKWYKKEGDPVAKGEPVFAVETDKTSIDIDATGDGIVKKLLIDEGAEVPVTLPIAIIGQMNEDVEHLVADAFQKLGKAEKASSPIKPGAGPAETKDSATGRVTGAYDYDIAVVGGGPGGYVAAIKAAQMGKKTVIFEKDSLGGTCLNVGCIPTKALLRSAEALKAVKEASKFGVQCVNADDALLDMAKVQERKRSVVSHLVGGVNGLLRGNKVDVVKGEARITDLHTLTCREKAVTASHIIIATGSEVKHLPVPTDPQMDVLTSKELLDLDHVPESMTVIGGGVIGIEFAYFLASVGTKVTVIEFMDHILPMVDEEITEHLCKQLSEMGIEIHTGARVTEIGKDYVKFEKDGMENKLAAEKVLMAVGRVPSFAGIPVEDLGIRTERGAIATDLTLKTSVDHIYAIGDVNGKSMLAHTASMEALVAVENICGKTVEMDYSKIPSGIYTQPEVASVGLTEAQARIRYGEIKIGRFPLLANGKAKVEGEEKGLVKVIVDGKYGEILGVHLYCIHATDMIAESVAAMRLEGTAEEIAMAVHPHPTVSEVMHEAFHSAVDRAIHFL